MKKQKLTASKQTGFTVMKLLIGLLIVMGVGVIIALVYAATHKKPATEGIPSSSQTTKAEDPETAANRTADWVPYSSTVGKYSLEYPPTWATPENSENCSPGLLLLAKNRLIVGRCASDYMGQISVMSVPNDKSKDYVLNDSAFSDIKTENISVDKQGGSRQSGTSKGTGSGEIKILPEGTKLVLYTFYVAGDINRTYVAQYQQRPRYPDTLGDFDLMIKQTLKFSK